MKTYKEVIQLVDYGWNKPEWSLAGFGSDEGYQVPAARRHSDDKEAVIRLLVEEGWEKICDMPEGAEVWGRE